MESLLEGISEFLPMVIIAGAIILGMLIKSVTAVLVNISRERSRREIAAYIAEGSISPEHGEQLLRADVRSFGGCET